MSSETISIKVRRGATDLSLAVSKGTTFREVKAMVEREWKVSVDRQRFVFAGREPSDEQTLAASGVGDGFVLLLFPAKRARPAEERAAPETTGREDDAAGWLRGNRLQQHFSSSDLEARFRSYRNAAESLRAAFDRCRQSRNVALATRAFKRVFDYTLFEANDDLRACRKRLAALDGLTEALVTSEAPCDGNDAARSHRTMMLSIGSRWLIALAFFSTRLGETGAFAAALHARATALLERAAEPETFRLGFSVLLDLSRPRTDAEAKGRFLKACNNLHRSIRRRLDFHVRLAETDASRRQKFNVVQSKDSVMVPYLRQVLESNRADFPEEKFAEAMFHADLCAFFHYPTAEHWDRAFSAAEHRTAEHLRCALDHAKCCMEAPYTFSTRRKKRFERFALLTVCHLHVATAPYVGAERKEGAVEVALKGVQAMSEIAVAPSMEGALAAFRERFAAEVGNVSEGQRARLLEASKGLFERVNS